VAALDGALPAQMVVLNACVSGRFEAPLAGEVGGFWEGFLRAGAASLVATLVYVHPSDALDLVLAFYRNWLPGHLTKAEALRQAQLELRRRQPEPEHWATHILVGDGA
jgi:CHAT domain-containing protein